MVPLGDCRAYFLENPLTFQLTMARTVFYENMPSRRQHGISCRAVGILTGKHPSRRIMDIIRKRAISKRIPLAGTLAADNNKGQEFLPVLIFYLMLLLDFIA